MSTADPWAIQRWAFAQTTGSSTRKAVLMALAVMADATTGRCEPKQETIARWVEAGERTIRDHLGALEEAGLIARRPQYRVDGGRRSDEFLLLAPGVDAWPDGAPAPRQNTPGAPGDQPPGPPAAGRRARTTTMDEGQALPAPTRTGARERAREAAQRIPDDFPDELRPHAREVMRVLKAVAEQHGARQVTPLAVARIVQGYPRRPLVEAAHAFAAWAADPPRPIRDVVASYRTWVSRERDLATIERLDGAPLPAAPAGVVPIHQPRSAEERRMVRQQRRLAVARGEVAPTDVPPMLGEGS